MFHGCQDVVRIWQDLAKTAKMLVRRSTRFAMKIHSNLSKTMMKIDVGYIWKMYIGGSFTKCKPEIPILIHEFPILLNKKVLPF